MAKIPVSIVVPYYHRENKKMPDNYDSDMLKDCIDSILRNTTNYELIVVNNGSTVDESWVKQFADKYIEYDKNMGISTAWNAGIKEASNQYIVEFCCNWL